MRPHLSSGTSTWFNGTGRWLVISIAAAFGFSLSLPSLGAPLTPKPYRISYPPLESSASDFKLNERGDIFAVRSTPKPNTPSGYPYATEFLVYRPSRETGQPIGLQRIPGPTTSWMGSYSLVDVNENHQFVCSERSNGDSFDFLWNGTAFVRLDFSWFAANGGFIQNNALVASSLGSDGTSWGSVLNGDEWIAVRWGSGGGTPIVTGSIPYGSQGPIFLSPRNHSGTMLRYKQGVRGWTEATYWDGASVPGGAPVLHPESSQLLLNDRNQIIGIDVANGEFWLHLPTPSYGLTSGLNRLGRPAPSVNSPLLFNNSGQFFISGGPGVLEVWDKGTFVEPQFTDASSTPVTVLSLLDVNDRGMILTTVSRGGTQALALLTPTDLDVTAVAAPPELALGEEFDLQLTIRNNLEIPLKRVGVLPASLFFTGIIGADWIAAPPSLLTLAPGASGKLNYRFRTKALGQMRIRFQVEGYDVSNQRAVLTESLASPEITIKSPLEVSITPSTNHVDLGESFQVSVVVRNNTRNRIDSITLDPALLEVTGTGKLKYRSGPKPSVTAALAGLASQTVIYEFEGSGPGAASLATAARGRTTAGAAVASPKALSERVIVGITGDLIIKRRNQSTPQYGLDDVYQTTPRGRQIRTNSVAAGVYSEFDVRIQNDAASPQIFRLKATESGTEDWLTQFRFGGVDVTTAVYSSAGWQLPELGANKFHTMTLRSLQTNAVEGASRRVILSLRSPQLPDETLDSVEAVSQTALEIVVNSDADLPDKDGNDCCCDTGRQLKDGTPECTLRAAIETANRRPGAEVIRFAIQSPDGAVRLTASIFPETPLPAITDQLAIDGYTQNPSATKPPIELTGILIPSPGNLPADQDQLTGMNGLTIHAASSLVTGLVISWFPDFGIRLDGDANQVTRCFIGTDPTGQIPRANGVTSDDWENFTSGGGILVSGLGNEIGGPGIGNVISGNRDGYRTITTLGGTQTPSTAEPRYVAGPGIVLAEGAHETRIHGNLIGLTKAGDSVPTSANSGRLLAGILVESNGNLIGGSPDEPGMGNVIGVSLTGVTLTGSFNQVLGNQLGMSLDGLNVGNEVGIHVAGGDNRVGDSQVGNILAYNRWGIRVVDADRFTVQRNVIGYSTGLNENSRAAFQWVGIEVMGKGRGSHVDGNFIYHQSYEGIRVGGDGRPVNGLSIVGNEVVANGQAGSPEPRMAGIHIAAGTENGISMNLVYRNHLRAISLIGSGNEDGSATLVNDPGDHDNGPNTLLNFPELTDATLTGTQIEVLGDLMMTPGRLSYRVEFFASLRGVSGGEKYLGYANFDTEDSGHVAFLARMNGGVESGEFITATAIDPRGNTSEYSNPILAQGPADEEQDGMSDAVESQTPDGKEASPSQTGLRRSGPLDALGHGDGNADGVADSKQANVVSFPSVEGMWLTLSTSSQLAFKAVEPRAMPKPESAPAGYSFPVGFVQCTVTGLPNGGGIVITNRLHDPIPCTTVFAFGPTTDNPAPHWYEFLFDGSVGAKLGTSHFTLSLIDARTGDHDLKTDGRITTFFAPAFRIPTGPPITVLGTTISEVDKVDVTTNPDGNRSFITNRVSLTTSVLAWPADETGWFLQSADSLSPATLWETVVSEPSQSNHQKVINATSAARERYYRLQQFPP